MRDSKSACLQCSTNECALRAPAEFMRSAVAAHLALLITVLQETRLTQLLLDLLGQDGRPGCNQAIFARSYDRGSAGRFHHPQSQLHRFMNCFGSYTSSVNFLQRCGSRGYRSAYYRSQSALVGASNKAFISLSWSSVAIDIVSAPPLTFKQGK